MSWPFKLKLKPDNLRTNCLKISPSPEFEQHIISDIDAASKQQLDKHIPVEISIFDEDTKETYEVTLAKKEYFWFGPYLEVGETKKKQQEQSSNGKEKPSEEFAYSIEPFKDIVKKRQLGWDQEIGLRWTGSEKEIKFNFSVLEVPQHCYRLDLKG